MLRFHAQQSFDFPNVTTQGRPVATATVLLVDDHPVALCSMGPCLLGGPTMC